MTATLLLSLNLLSGTVIRTDEECLRYQAKTQWQAARKASFAAPEPITDAYWHALLSCLASTDSELRDHVGYEALTRLLRNNTPSPAIIAQLFGILASDIQARADNANQTYLPFAVLAFAEVLRTDRITPHLSAAQRQRAVDLISKYLPNIQDYRGFSDRDGWRHHVAHSADVVLQLALNPAINRVQLNTLADALATQILNEHHVFSEGEPYRLARAMVYLMMHPNATMQDKTNWLTAPFSRYEPAKTDSVHLRQRHNLRFVLLELANLLKGAPEELQQSILPILNNQLAQL